MSGKGIIKAANFSLGKSDNAGGSISHYDKKVRMHFFFFSSQFGMADEMLLISCHANLYNGMQKSILKTIKLYTRGRCLPPTPSLCDMM